MALTKGETNNSRQNFSRIWKVQPREREK